MWSSLQQKIQTPLKINHDKIFFHGQKYWATSEYINQKCLYNCTIKLINQSINRQTTNDKWPTSCQYFFVNIFTLLKSCRKYSFANCVVHFVLLKNTTSNNILYLLPLCTKIIFRLNCTCVNEWYWISNTSAAHLKTIIKLHPNWFVIASIIIYDCVD